MSSTIVITTGTGIQYYNLHTISCLNTVPLLQLIMNTIIIVVLLLQFLENYCNITIRVLCHFPNRRSNNLGDLVLLFLTPMEPQHLNKRVRVVYECRRDVFDREVINRTTHPIVVLEDGGQ